MSAFADPFDATLLPDRCRRTPAGWPGSFDALVYNWLVLAADGHAKNYSLLLSGHQVRLAPLYDVASALAHLDHPRKARMAKKIGGEYRRLHSTPTLVTNGPLTRPRIRRGTRTYHGARRSPARRALADAASGPHLTVDEQRIADTIRDQISSWAAERVDELL